MEFYHIILLHLKDCLTRVDVIELNVISLIQRLKKEQGNEN